MVAIQTTTRGIGGLCGGNVIVTSKEVVAVALPLQEHRLPLSNMDLLLPPVDVSVFFCYKYNNIMSGTRPTFNQLKKGLAKALLTYYAFAGELVLNSAGEPELLCNNRGVDFIEAATDMELCDLNLYDPDHSIEGKYTPKQKRGVLSVQATKLKCGGLVVACTFDHRIADAYTANMFLVTWAELANSKELSLPPPTFRRSLLSPRRPGNFDRSVEDMYITVPAGPKQKDRDDTTTAAKSEKEDKDHFVSRIYSVSAESISLLQSLANIDSTGKSKKTKFVSFSTFLWKLVTECAREEMKCVRNKTSKMGIVVDGRTRLGQGMTSYFGNVVSIPYCAQDMEELTERPLNHAAETVHGFVQATATNGHFLGLVDWVEAHRPQQGLAKIYCTGSQDGPSFVVSSGLRFPVAKMDFGWGKPVFGSYHFPWGGDAGYVMPMPSLAKDGDWVVYLRLPKRQLDRMELQAAAVLRPLTSQYLNL